MKWTLLSLLLALVFIPAAESRQGLVSILTHLPVFNHGFRLLSGAVLLQMLPLDFLFCFRISCMGLFCQFHSEDCLSSLADGESNTFGHTDVTYFISLWTIYLWNKRLNGTPIYRYICVFMTSTENNASTEEHGKASHSWSFGGRILLFPRIHMPSSASYLAGSSLSCCVLSHPSCHLFTFWSSIGCLRSTRFLPCTFLTSVLPLQANAPLFHVPPWLSFVPVFRMVTTWYARMGWVSLKSWVWRSEHFVKILGQN